MKRTTTTYTVLFRRKREGRTNYKKRLKLLLSNKPRLVIRKSIKNMIVQIIDYAPKGDLVKVSAHTSELAKIGWKFGGSNMPSAYLAGMLAAAKAKKKKMAECVLDIGLSEHKKGSIIYAALKGAVDGGLNIPHSKEILPANERVTGQHIAKFAELVKKDKEKYSRQFSEYIKNGADPVQMPKQFEEIKNKILKM